MQEHMRELSRAIALGDVVGAKIIIDLIARDKPKYAHQISLGQSDASVIRARDVRPQIVKLASAARSRNIPLEGRG